MWSLPQVSTLVVHSFKRPRLNKKYLTNNIRLLFICNKKVSEDAYLLIITSVWTLAGAIERKDNLRSLIP
jgi:hypothetical protein